MFASHAVSPMESPALLELRHLRWHMHPQQLRVHCDVQSPSAEPTPPRRHLEIARSRPTRRLSTPAAQLEIWVTLMNCFVNELSENVTKDVALDQTTYGSIQSAYWEAHDYTFLGPYSPGAALGVEPHCFGPWAQVFPSRPKKNAKKAPNLSQRQG